MADRYNPFGLPYLDAPAERPNYSVDSRWPDQPDTANAFRMGGLAGQGQGPADIRTPAAGMRMADMAGEMLAPDDVLGAATALNPIKTLGKAGRAVPAIAGMILGADPAEASDWRRRRK